ncbi:MAG: DegT/DnrJ/EryC1/StrS family aminotransferase [Deltaproteobacteria bacterium]|nr:DegT/DnrJ/EryC1/StrS family aminotransferase [Deltaproteobacteria bacterium]
MVNLIPTENWEFGLIDAIFGLNAIFKSSDSFLINIPGLGEAIPVRSGRVALVEAIKALKLKKGSKIGVPLYNCPAVLKSITYTGCQPVFIDIDPNTLCISPDDLQLKLSTLSAIIVVHMFGNICDIPKIKKIAYNIPIIEDCAQAIGSKLNGKYAGSFGDVAIFSFRSGKYLSVGEGGAIYSNKKNVFSRAYLSISKFKTISKSEEIAHIVKTYIRNKLRNPPFFGTVGLPIWKNYNSKTSTINQTPIIIGRIYKSDYFNTNKRIKYLPKNIKKQQNNTQLYNNVLKNLKLDITYNKKNIFNCYLYYIVLPTIQDRDVLDQYLFQNNICAIKPYQNCVEVGRSLFGYKRDCPVTENISKRIICIPSHYRLKRSEVDNISSLLKTGLQQILH